MAENLTTADNINLPSLSRYRNTRVFDDRDLNQVYFGTWRVPKIIENKPVSIHRVKPEELNRPDLIAFRVYGNSTLFWVIAVRNNLLLPLRDMSVGQALVCPHLDDVMRAISSSFSNNPGTA